MDEKSQKLRLLLKDKDFASVQQALELLSCFSEDDFWDIFGSIESMDDINNFLLNYPHKEFLKIWIIGTLHEYAPDWFVPIQKLEIEAIPYLEAIPQEITLCHELRELVIDGGKMKTLPSFLQKLSKLEKLTIAKVSLSKFPLEICDGPLSKSLKDLHFQECPFTDIPNEIAKLEALESLGFSEIHLKKMTSNISQCHALRSLTIYFHRTYYWRRQIVPFRLPLSILEIPNLEKLYLSNMVMDNEEDFFQRYLECSVVVDDEVCFPFEILGLNDHIQKGLYRQLLKNHHLAIVPYIRVMDLSEKRMSVLGESLQKFCGLENLNLQYNNLTELPKDFWHIFPKLKHLNLSHNSLTELPKGNWPEGLCTLLVHHNRLSSIESHSSLVLDGVMNLSHNQISSFPTDLIHQSSIIEVNIAHNQYEEVPQELEKYTSLERLYLQGNNISDLPLFIASLPLTEFQAQKNRITRIREELYSLIDRPIFSKGKFVEQERFVWPYRANQQIHQVRMKKFFAKASLEECKGMYKLDLSGLGWTEIPPIIFQISTLHHLNLSGNQLTMIPEEIGNLENLITFNVRDNRIRCLPKSLEKLTRLKKLFLGDNKISQFPSGLYSCAKLEQLNVSGNQLTEIPASIWDFPKLSICVLKNNRISIFPKPNESVSKNWQNINLKGNPFCEDFGLSFIRTSKEES
ncbi:MAG: hypothetical protein CL916_13430 [Deltaproteobacteria bacterium]|nr:hypothetical protein [Deltaproteobacteria bacterium]